MANVVFREAESNDLLIILQLLTEGSRAPEQSGDKIAGVRRAFEYVRRDQNNSLIVAELAGQVVACAQMTIIPGLTLGGAFRAHVEAVRVASRAQGQGIGTALLQEIIRRAHIAKCASVQLLTHKSRHRTHCFYSKLGFVASHEGMKLALE